jgi:hypothetical protein
MLRRRSVCSMQAILNVHTHISDRHEHASLKACTACADSSAADQYPVHHACATAACAARTLVQHCGPVAHGIGVSHVSTDYMLQLDTSKEQQLGLKPHPDKVMEAASLAAVHASEATACAVLPGHVLNGEQPPSWRVHMQWQRPAIA